MRIACVVCVLGLTACAAPRAHVNPAAEADLLDVDDDTAVAADPGAAAHADEPAHIGAPPRVACYFGDLMVKRPGEVESNQGALLVKLTLDQTQSTMTEETWSFPLYERYVVTRAIRGSQFTQRQDDGSFTGAGSLEGQPWIWNRWTATTTSADQRTRVETDTRFESGALVTRERVMEADGGTRVEVSHSLYEVPLDECDNMFAKARTNAARMHAASAGD